MKIKAKCCDFEGSVDTDYIEKETGMKIKELSVDTCNNAVHITFTNGFQEKRKWGSLS